MATNNGVNVSLSGQTGSGSFVGSTSPTITTPTLTSPIIGTGIFDSNGNEIFLFTATASAVNDVTFANAATGNSPTFTASGGDTNIILTLNGKGTGGVALKGTGTNNNAASGQIGEIVYSNVVSGSAIALTSGIAANITSISLTAGDWDLSAVGCTNVGGSTTTSAYNFWINTVSASFPASNTNLTPIVGANAIPTNTGQVFNVALPAGRISLPSTTTLYFSVQATFAASTLSAYGWVMARRAR